MKGLVGSLRTPKGGFGNRVMSFLSLRHIASALDTHYFSTNDLDRSRVAGISSKPFLPLSLLKVERATSDDLFQAKAIDILGARIRRGRSLVFQKPLLGEVFARFAPVGLAQMPRLKCRTCAIHRFNHDDGRQVALHFRGGDFAQWKPEAVLSDDYYLNAIDLLVGRNSDLRFRIFTDDQAHPAIPRVAQRLEQLGMLIGSQTCDQAIECDYASIANSSIIVASPSTFALTAAMFSNALVIHSEEWVRACEEKGEVFWKMVRDKSLPGLSDSEIV